MKLVSVSEAIKERQAEVDAIMARSWSSPESLEHAVKLSKEIELLKAVLKVRMALRLRGAA